MDHSGLDLIWQSVIQLDFCPFQLIQRIIQCINMSGYSYYYEKLFVSGTMYCC